MGRKKYLPDKTEHPKTENAPGFEALEKAITEFTNAMRSRLLKKHTEGKTGWNAPSFIKGPWTRKVENILLDSGFSGWREKDCVDLANYMLFQFEWQKNSMQRLRQKMKKGSV